MLKPISKKSATKKPATEKTNGGIKESSMTQAIALRAESSTINRYLLKKRSKAVAGVAPTNGRRASLQDRIAEIDTLLAKGTKEWSVPVGKPKKGDKRESIKRELPLRPTEIARLLQKKMSLVNRLSHGSVRKSSAKTVDLRAEFLRVLPAWAQRKGYSSEVLTTIGVSMADLVEAGIVKMEHQETVTDTGTEVAID